MAVAKAVCVIRSISDGSSLGEVRLTQRSDEAASTRITGRIRGLKPGPHGLRVCVFGDETGGAVTLGPIYNPLSKRHGAREDAERDAGALGNVEAGASGVAEFDFIDSKVFLIGPLSVIGRSLCVTAQADDGGKGASASSAIDGSAGPVIAAGVIGIAVG